MGQKTQRWSTDLVLWRTVILLIILFLIDLQLPLGVAGGIPYIAVVVYASTSPHRPLPYFVALTAALLTVVGGFLSAPGAAAYWMGIVNRSLAIGGIFVVAFLADRRNRAEVLRAEERAKNEEKLKRVNEELESFSQVLSHDLRNQLSPIIYSSDFLRDEYERCLDEEGMRIVDEMGSRGRRMLALMEDLLQLARVGRLEVPARPADVERVVADVLGDFEGRIEEAGMTVVCGPLAAAMVPETLMAQVFANLIANALNYAAEKGGRLEIGSEADRESVRFFVRDHGPGVSPKEREAVFESFRRGAAHRQKSGSGMGLAIVKKVATLYGGRAWVEETPGGGATFFVEVVRHNH